MNKITRFACCFFIIPAFLVAQNTAKIRYVALGDSYTICTGATTSESWPLLLAADLTRSGIPAELVANPARNGYSTRNLIDHELPVLEKSKADFVTLLIGVNDWVREVSAEEFKKNLVYILDKIQATVSNKQQVLLIGIPDFGVTPQGSQYANGRDISQGIQQFNAIIKAEALKRKLSYVDVYTVSLEMKNNSSLVAADGLHPSAAEYALWEKLIFPVAKSLLQKK